MRTCELRRVAVGARIGWTPTGEVGQVVEKDADGLRVRWQNGTIGRVAWSDAKQIAHAGRAPRPDVAARAKGGA